MVRSPSFTEYLSGSGGIPDDALLGHLVIFTIRDTEYKIDDIAKKFADIGLNDRFLPTQVRAVDAFKKSCTVFRETVLGQYGTTTDTLLIRPVLQDANVDLRHVIREIRESDNRVLTHTKVAELCLYRPTIGSDGKVSQSSARLRTTVTHILDDPNGSEYMRYREWLSKFDADFQTRWAHVDGARVRMVVRDYLNYLNAVQLKPSVYFLHIDRKDDLLKLQQFVSGIGCTMHLIPLIDVEEQREMVISAYQAEAVTDLDGLTTDIAHLIEARKAITPGAYKGMLEKYTAITTKAVEYTEKLGLTQARTAGAAEAAQQMLVNLKLKMIKDQS